MTWETVTGLEVHVQLLTQTKLFCGCRAVFGAEPNTNICEICTGQPGTLPLPNEKAVEFALRTGIATNCSITRTTRFDRKNYFYPDLPKAYQISQLYLPVCTDGFIEIDTRSGIKRIRIHEIHIEEDAGKLLHDGDITLIDYNRCGVPLLEIVTEPDFRGSDEVIAFLTELKGILTYIGVSDCKMQEGSMRVDVNLSVRPLGDAEFGTRTEMKNLNSFHEIADAMESEAARQISVIEGGEAVIRQTRRWDADKRMSFSMRSKEEANDYRYFPEPDIPPVIIGDSLLNSVKSELPELPRERRRRYEASLGLSKYDADQLTQDRCISDFFEAVSELCGSPKQAANWILGEVLRLLSENKTEASQNPLKPEALAEIITLVRSGKITRATGKQVLERAFLDGVDVTTYIAENSLALITDESEILKAVRRAVDGNPKSVADYKGGKTSALGFLVGQTMKLLGGKADANTVKRLLTEIIG